MDHKTFAFKLTNLDFTGRTLEGYANVFNVKDLVGDIVHPGAFAKTLLERGGRIKFLWQHDVGEPIGRPVELREDPNGLYIKAIISDTQRGRDALALLHDGAIGEMSIGFDTVKGGLDYSKDAVTGDTIRNLREVKLYEVSLVTFPANESAIVTGLKQEPSERKPWDVFPMDGRYCVYKVDEDGHHTGESLGCHDSEDEARQQVEALYANEKEHAKEAVPDGQLCPYCLADLAVTKGGWYRCGHCKETFFVKEPDGDHKNYRTFQREMGDGEVPEDVPTAEVLGLPVKMMDESEKGKMERMMAMMGEMQEMMRSMMGGGDKPEKGEKAGRRLRTDKVELVRQLQGIVEELRKWADYDDEDPAPPDGAASDEKPKDDKAGPLPETAPTSADLLALIELETTELSLMR